MSTDRNSPPLQPAAANGRRRSSLVDLFNRAPNGAGASAGTSAYGPITSAAAQAQRRRLSLSTVGLGAAQPQPSPFGTGRSRTESISSSGSASLDESPFEDGDAFGASSSGTSPFARRLSFGARALRDVRTSNGTGNANGAGEGFNFAENMRTRAERGSISGASLPSPTATTHSRAKSVAVMEPPVREVPRAAKPPDVYQERMLKGDFYMD